MLQDFSALGNNTDKELQQVKGTIEGISDDLHEKINAHIVDIRKGTERVAHEVNARSKSLIAEMQKYKGDTESEVMSVKLDFSKFWEEITADHTGWQLKAGTDIEKVSGSMKVMEDRVANFQVAVEGNNSIR
jgi:archaellum component FlaC